MKKIKQVPWSNDAVTSRIAEMSCDIVNQAVTAIKESPVRISVQLDQWFPTFLLSRRILEKNENYLAHLEYFEYKIYSN